MRVFIQKIISTNNYTLEEIISAPRSIYTFLNPVSYLTARKNKKTFKEFDGIFADGSILVLFINLFYRKNIDRVSFDMTSLAPKLLEHCALFDKNIYFVGATFEEINKFILLMKTLYPNLKYINGVSGYFNNEEEKINTIKKILSIKPDYLIVGMGAPLQEKFLIDIKNAGFTGIGFTCGGFIHQTTEQKEQYYPNWINKFNLRFVYRFYKEKHTRNRYLNALVLFPLIFIKNYIFKSNN